jgi:hypothetical protein
MVKSTMETLSPSWLRFLRRHRLDPPHLKDEVQRIATKWWRRARRIDHRIAHLEPRGTSRGRVLFSYIVDPFLLPQDREIPYSHTHFWESATIGHTFRDLGFRVEAISWTNQRFMPRGEYDFLLDVRLNLERLAPLLPSATKILHADTAHYTFHNPAQLARLRQLEERRGIAIAPQKMLPENRALETADLVTLLGNHFTRETYAFAGKPLHRIPISVPFTYAWPEGKDFAAARRHFLWFGSGGLVHKGLDLVLEVFARNPDLQLWVCGPIRREKDFEKLYFRELYEKPNIHTVGWVDVGGERFLDIARRCGGLLYPSCSEGGGSSALTCMHAAIVPLVNREVSIDVDDDRGVRLPDCRIETLEAAVRDFSERPATEVEALARRGWEYVRQHHTKHTFREGYRSFAEALVEGRLPTESAADA